MASKRRKSGAKKSRAKTQGKKLWGGGYGKKTAGIVETFTESVSFDRVLAPYDIKGSIAHARMLGRQKLIPAKDAARIRKGLSAILKQIESGSFVWDVALEDVHMNIESALTKSIGDAGARLHTGRSRNDQVATTFRLYCADAAKNISRNVARLVKTLGEAARRDGKHVLPGYTHLQQAQPVTFRTHLGAYIRMFERDLDNFAAAEEEAMAEMPLGAAALAGTSLKLDRNFTARELGFKRPSVNPMDAVSNRDFAVKLVYSCAVLGMHLSRLSEDIIIFSSKEFGFIALDDTVTTGSSLMPQKKNPDVCELARGKTGRVYGDLFSLLTTLKGLPMTYNRDMQEDKEPVFDAVETALGCTGALTEAVKSMRFIRDKARAALDLTMLATDLADHLVKNGLPFRHAHEVIARLVHSHPDFSKIDESALAKAHPLLKGAMKSLDFDRAVKLRKL